MRQKLIVFALGSLVNRAGNSYIGARKLLEKLKEQGYMIGVVSEEPYDKVERNLTRERMFPQVDFFGCGLFTWHDAVRDLIGKAAAEPKECCFVAHNAAAVRNTIDIRDAKGHRVMVVAFFVGYPPDHSPTTAQDFRILKLAELPPILELLAREP